MKKAILICIGAIVGLTISAQAQSGRVQAKIPFNFTVFGKTLVAGDYSITTDSHLINIVDSNRRLVLMAPSYGVSDRTAKYESYIVFHCYQDHCFLSEIWFGPHENGRQLFTSKEEASLAREQKGQYFAVLSQKPNK